MAKQTVGAIEKDGKLFKLIGASGTEPEAAEAQKIYEDQGYKVIIEKETRGIFKKRYRWLHYVYYAERQGSGGTHS